MIVTTSIAYVVTLVVFVLIDLIWLTFVGGPMYRQALGDVLAPSVRMAPALAFYLIYPLGLVVFAVHPALNSGHVLTALLLGALYGFFTYVTYDLTNLATLRNWTIAVTMIDIAWGCALGGATAALTVVVTPAIQAALGGSA